jgi:peptide/nickel transport system ATP-binding protein
VGSRRGKSITGTAIIRVAGAPRAHRGRRILLDGERIDNLPAEQMRKIRGRRIGAIFRIRSRR